MVGLGGTTTGDRTGGGGGSRRGGWDGIDGGIIGGSSRKLNHDTR